MPPVPTGLSAATASLQNNTYAKTYGAGGSPAEIYQKYKKDTQPLEFLSFPPDTPKYTLVLVARKYTLGSIGATSGSAGEGKYGFVMPIPQMATDRYDLAYDANYAFLNFIDSITRLPVVGGLAQSAIGAGKAVTGLSLNKYKTVLFEAPHLKRHHFSWKFSPKTSDEAATIRAIVNLLKICSAPSLSDLTLNAIMQFPYIFDIYYQPNFYQMYGFKPSVIESISVDYGGGNPHPAFYKDGYPESVILTLSMLELEFWSQGDYEGWYDNVTNPTDTLRPTIINRLPGNGTNDPSRQNETPATQTGSNGEQLNP